jgi:DNA-binding NarL/FixJ family response regulator
VPPWRSGCAPGSPADRSRQQCRSPSSPREREILDGVAAGLTNAQIGQRTFLSAKTVANNVTNILAKLQLAERGQAIVAARDAGLGRRPRGEPGRS